MTFFIVNERCLTNYTATSHLFSLNSHNHLLANTRNDFLADDFFFWHDTGTVPPTAGYTNEEVHDKLKLQQNASHSSSTDLFNRSTV